MGVAVQGICYPNQTLAASAFCQSLTVNGINSTGQVVSHSCVSYTTTTATISKLINTTTSSQVITLPTFLGCTHDGGATAALDYFYAGLVILAVIWAAKRIMYLFTNSTSPV